jgi:tRNA dimethylallyltransferase
MQISLNSRLARHDRSELASEAASPVAQSGFGMVVTAGLHAHSIAASRAASGAAQQTSPDHPLVAIVGPTASGKSALALHLARVLDGEVVNYDSVQLFRGFDIGSGKVSLEERLRVPHHLLDIVNSDEIMTAGRYRRLALTTLAEIRDRPKAPVLVGGTGLYLRALLRGLFQGPSRSDELRARLRVIEARHGRPFLHALLRRLDPEAARRIHFRDAQKVIRAVEVCLLSGEPISKLHQERRESLAGFRVFKVGLNPDRSELRERINRRVESMFASGLVEETRLLLEQRGFPRRADSGPWAALGYRQACQVLRGEISLAEAARDTQAATRRYAKRQLTWFRQEPEVTWFNAFGDDPDLQARASQWLLHAIANARTQPENPTSTALNRLTAERIQP